jgi:hypothetical protein
MLIKKNLSLPLIEYNGFSIVLPLSETNLSTRDTLILDPKRELSTSHSQYLAASLLFLDSSVHTTLASRTFLVSPADKTTVLAKDFCVIKIKTKAAKCFIFPPGNWAVLKLFATSANAGPKKANQIGTNKKFKDKCEWWRRL